MKKTADGFEVVDRTWYYLLDFNDRTNWKYIRDNFNKERLLDLTRTEYKQLFKHATEADLKENL